MRKFLVAFIICGISCSLANADTMVVKVPVLNVRHCPSTNCNIIKKLSKGNKIKVNNIDKGWAEVAIGKNEIGYSISRSLRKSYSYLWWYIIGAIIGYMLIVYMWEAFMNKCPKCGKWNALSEIDRECLEKIKSNITKVATTHYKNHTRRREYIVPATVYKYRITKKCCKCGYTTTVLETEKLEN